MLEYYSLESEEPPLVKVESDRFSHTRTRCPDSEHIKKKKHRLKVTKDEGDESKMQ